VLLLVTGTARIVREAEQGLCNGTVSVRLSVRPNMGPQPAAADLLLWSVFAAVGPTSRRHRSIAARQALSSSGVWRVMRAVPPCQRT